MDKDLTPEMQAEYETALEKKAQLGMVLAVVICGADILLGVLSGSFICAFAAVVLLTLTVFGKPQAKWLAVGIGGFYAVIGAMTLIDIPAVGESGRALYPYELAGGIELAFGAVSAVLFLKSKLIAAYFEYKTSINRKNNF